MIDHTYTLREELRGGSFSLALLDRAGNVVFEFDGPGLTDSLMQYTERLTEALLGKKMIWQFINSKSQLSKSIDLRLYVCKCYAEKLEHRLINYGKHT